MLRFDEKTKEITASTGGYRTEGLPIRDTFVQIGQGVHFQRGMLYEPVVPTEKSRIGVIVVHAAADYSVWNICGELAKRGYRTLGSVVQDPYAALDDKLLDVRRCVEFFRAYPGVEKIVLMGHSGGATLMSAYQRAAENGIASLQGDDMLVKLSLTEELPPADGIMTLDSNWGNGSMTVFSIDPAVKDDDNGCDLDPEYDYFEEKTGYSGQDTCYTEAFKKKFFAAQARRNNAIVRRALTRLEQIESGKGRFRDDEAFIIAGADQILPCNRLIPQDPHLLHHTREEHDLIHADGSITHEIVYSLRRSLIDSSPTPLFHAAASVGTVRSYLTEHAVLATEEYAIHEDRVTGIDWDHVYNCTPGNIKHVTVPLLAMGMTGSYEYLAAEEIYNNAAAKDKSLAFVEGAAHMFTANRAIEEYPGQFGDTEKLLFDYVDQWLETPGRFL